MRFLDFIENELKPIIKIIREVSIDPNDSAIIGHSLGGLFATWALLTRPDIFKRYISISPSLWRVKPELPDWLDNFNHLDSQHPLVGAASRVLILVERKKKQPTRHVLSSSQNCDWVHLLFSCNKKLGINLPAMENNRVHRINPRNSMRSIDTTIVTATATKPATRTATYSESGVDRTMLQWMASKTPEERLQILQANVTAIIKLRNGR